VSAYTGYSDTIEIKFQNLQNYGYRWVNSGSDCGTGLSGTAITTYTNPIMLSSDLTFNGKYLCAYGEDSTGSGKYIVSDNDVNISDYGDTVNFIDDVSETRVSSDNIEILFSGAFAQKKYTFVEYLSDCNNTGNMVDYT
jgi:hypothetical protein